MNKLVSFSVFENFRRTHHTAEATCHEPPDTPTSGSCSHIETPAKQPVPLPEPGRNGSGDYLGTGLFAKATRSRRSMSSNPVQYGLQNLTSTVSITTLLENSTTVYYGANLTFRERPPTFERLETQVELLEDEERNVPFASCEVVFPSVFWVQIFAANIEHILIDPSMDPAECPAYCRVSLQVNIANKRIVIPIC